MKIVYHTNSTKTTIDGMRIYPTGSRLFGCSTAKSDVDYFCYASKDFYSKLSADGWVQEGKHPPNFRGELLADGRPLKSNYPKSSFRSYRKGLTNIIVCLDVRLYIRFQFATEICMKLQGPKTKEERIKLFQIILYGDHEYGSKL